MKSSTNTSPTFSMTLSICSPLSRITERPSSTSKTVNKLLRKNSLQPSSTASLPRGKPTTASPPSNSTSALCSSQTNSTSNPSSKRGFKKISTQRHKDAKIYYFAPYLGSSVAAPAHICIKLRISPKG